MNNATLSSVTERIIAAITKKRTEKIRSKIFPIKNHLNFISLKSTFVGKVSNAEDATANLIFTIQEQINVTQVMMIFIVSHVYCSQSTYSVRTFHVTIIIHKTTPIHTIHSSQ